MISARTWAALLLGRQAAFWSRTLRRGGGEALPGLLAERVSPLILSELTASLPEGVVMATGTNGKTTTSLAVSLILTDQGRRVLRNRGGSNLARGLVSSLVESSRLTHPRPAADIAIFEVDEATMPQVTAHVSPRLILVTNIFRDQLDRFAEIETTAALIRHGIENSPNATLVLNADDPLVAALGCNRPNAVYFGLEDSTLEPRTVAAIDAADCPVCGSPLGFDRRFFSHLGHYACAACGFVRPRCHVCAHHVHLSPRSSSATIEVGERTLHLTSEVPGLYNLYNFLGAVAVAEQLGVSPQASVDTLSRMQPAFGRLEKFSLDGRRGIIHLVKNPAGFNQVIDNVSAWEEGTAILLCLNDNIADGTDISWIWEVDFAPLVTSFPSMVVAGTRAPELALRLKYAGATPDQMRVEPHVSKALHVAKEEVAPGATLHILTTYTAMLELRNHLVRAGVLQEYWR